MDKEIPKSFYHRAKGTHVAPTHTFGHVMTWSTQEIQWFEGSGRGRLTVAVNYGKQQFQVVLCLLYQVPTLILAPVNV